MHVNRVFGVKITIFYINFILDLYKNFSFNFQYWDTENFDLTCQIKIFTKIYNFCEDLLNICFSPLRGRMRRSGLCGINNDTPPQSSPLGEGVFTLPQSLHKGREEMYLPLTGERKRGCFMDGVKSW